MTTFLSIGSGPGMGFATAERFAKGDFQVVLSARNAAKTRELADQLKAKGYRAEARTVDTGDASSVASLVAGAGGEARTECLPRRVWGRWYCVWALGRP